MGTPIEGPSVNTGRVQGQQMIEQAADELTDMILLFVDETDNREQILEFVSQVAETGASVYKLKENFPGEALEAVGARLALAIADRLINIFVLAPIPK